MLSSTSRKHVRTAAVAAIALVAVAWGPAASSAPVPAQHRQGPVLISHLMSSCHTMSSL
jgi:hypothetical protein